MGRGGGKRGRGGNRNKQQRYQQDRGSYEELTKSNEQFENYYNELAIVPEDERDLFWAAMRAELPNSFRFTGSKGHALAVQQRLVNHYIPQIKKVEWNGELVEPPEPIAWYPEQLAWHMKTSKQVIRKFPPFASFQKFLVSETTVGNISRQEVVSMIPPLLMDIRPGMTVLDMCAAPGSKSAQLIEQVHHGEEARMRKTIHDIEKQNNRTGSPDGLEIEMDVTNTDDIAAWSDDGRSTGLLIANDSDYRRAQMLVHQVKRLNSPNLIVTNHDASQFPSIRIPSDTAKPKYLKFDRILADVPCSGDGTTRKNYNVWKDWTPGNALGLHGLQVRILVRALQMLKVGGRAVYSTCSLNPLENEAVISSAIHTCGGAAQVRIVDCSHELPELKRRPGMASWPVADKRGNLWNSWEEVQTALEDTTDRDALIRISESMFPKPNDEIHLDRCMRVYPYLQDTGGFFITVLEKVSEIKVHGNPSSKNQDTKAKLNTETKADPTVSVKDEPLDDVKSEATLEADVTTQSDAPTEATIQQSVVDAKRPATELDLEEERPTKVLKVEGDPPTPVAATIQAGKPLIPSGKARQNQPQEEHFKYLEVTHPILQDIFKFYQIAARFPQDRFMVRNATGEPAKAIYYTSTIVRDILTHNEGKGIKFVQAGVKMFMKQDAQGQDTCKWRIQSEGIPIIEPWVGESRIVRLYKRDTLYKLLKEMFIKVSQGGHESFGEIGQRVLDISMGCAVLRVEPSEDEDGFKERMVLPLWRSLYSANLMLPKEERKAMLLRFYNDDTPLIDHNYIKEQAKEKKRGNTSEPDNDVEKKAAGVKDTEDLEPEEVKTDDTKPESALSGTMDVDQEEPKT